jgi:TnpA family transposase
MPRRRALTTAQLDELFTLPAEKVTLVRYWTLTDTDLEAIHQRRRDRNRLGFALQLCVLRYPGRQLRPGELVPAAALRFVADQIDITPEALAAYAARFQTRYEQLDSLRADFGFFGFAPEHRREMLAWLLPVALTTTSAATIAATLMDELRRRRLIVPGPSLVDRLVSAAMASAER